MESGEVDQTATVFFGHFSDFRPALQGESFIEAASNLPAFDDQADRGQRTRRLLADPLLGF